MRKKVKKRGNGKVVTIYDETGKILHKLIDPLRLKFKARDVIQVMVGASILAIPVGLTEETWKLGETLPLKNVIAFMVLSVLFISIFVFYNYYKNNIKEHYKEFLKRVLSTYLISLLVVAVILTLIQVAPWNTNWILAFKRTIIVAFPASMSAAIADMIK